MNFDQTADSGANTGIGGTAMNSREVLCALQAGEISLEDAKKELIKTETAPEQSSNLNSSELSTKRNPNRHGENEEESRVKPQVDISSLGDHYGLVLSTVHSIDELSLRQWIVPEPDHDEVTIQVKASAINFPDTLCVKGLYPTMPDYPFVPGFEVSGIVTRLGSQVSGIDTGDEVIALTGKHMGGHACSVNVPMTNIVHKPDNISFEDACSLPVAFATVYYAFELGKLAPKEHVLIQTATGGCGLIAIQLAHLKGCTIYGTSSKQEKLDILKKLEISHAINYKTSEFDQEVKRITNNRGVDVVLNMLSGDGIQKGLNCLGPSGRYLEIAVHALKTSPKLDLSKLVQNQSIYSIDLRRLGFQRGFLGKDALDLMVHLIQSEKIMPIVSRIYPIHQIREALEYVNQARHIGKVVISHTNQAMIDCTDYCLERLLKQKRNSETNITAVKTTSHLISRGREEQIKEGVAVIGMSGQFPKSKTLAAFWDNLAHGRDCISEIPKERWSIDQYYDPDPEAHGKTYNKWMGVLEDADQFDPLFFNISPAEAEWMDPQQRLFLENSWRCIEDSGLNPFSLSGSRCGVFVGCSSSDYGESMNGQALNAQRLMGRATSILTARISYLLNLKGPCLAIDTACSSSLVAIAEACNSLILQASDLALAGGVCVMAEPSIHIMMSKTGMLSADGRCFTFDTRANGFVPGEGVGVVLLKRLSDAVRDQNPIYGVIRGWGINQDGKTNGITAPSVNSQILLEKDVYQHFNINPETISLVEAHGTGTKLGDPIEVEALTETFQTYTNKKNYCALGSVKSNIGHLLTAAGISGVIKVLLALKHRMLPPTINFETLNEHILLENSPFYINTELRPWDAAPADPRRACVSSFGFSGTNAHIVIEEYLPKIYTRNTPVLNNKNNPILFVLSAKSEDQLKIYAECMKSRVESQEDLNLADMAYTLQLGREAMDYRMAFLADSREALLTALEGFVNNNSAERVLRGQVKKSKDGVAVFEGDEDTSILLQTWIQKRKLKKVAELWVKGLNIDWNQLYGDAKPRRISLPTYPFARERYWIPEIDNQSAIRAATTAVKIHSFLHQNTSDLSEQRFTSIFTGEEFFLVDHVVKGRRVLPGAAHLEMARAAVDQAAGALEEGKKGIRLKNIVWARPIGVNGQPVEVHIGLYPEEGREIAYEIYSRSEGNGAEPLVHSQGRAELVSGFGAPILDIKALQARCSKRAVTPGEYYEAFKAMGIEYGPGYRGIEKVHVGADQVLAKLALPSTISDTKDQFVLHPSLMDSALQASTGLMTGAGNSISTGGIVCRKPVLPFALQELEILGGCASTMWALIRYSDGSKAGDTVQRLDIDMCDDQGKICVRMKGLTYQRESQSSILPHALQPVAVTEENFSHISDKPRGISLWSLSDDQILPSRPADQPSIASVSTRDFLSQPGNNDESKPVTHVQAVKSAEALQEELATSLAEALYMRLSDVDVDKQFIDMGLDSIIGVEWIRALNKQYGISIPGPKVYEYPTIRKFAGFLEKELNKEGIQPMDNRVIPDSLRFSAESPQHSQTRKITTVEPSPVHSTLKTFKKSRRFLQFGNPEIEQSESQPLRVQDIAVISLSGRYPQAKNIQEFWKNLQEGKDCITEIPKDRWDHSLYFDADKSKPGKTCCKWGSFMEGVDEFDPLFFNISPREAQVMDPQERLFLECVWNLLESAGYTREILQRQYQGRVGVYVGAMYQQYHLFKSDVVTESATALSSYSSIANRVSYFFDFQGPSMAIDTMCSSAAFAIHMACESLRKGDCKIAIAGGVNLSIHPKKYLGLSLNQMLGSHRNSRSFGNGDGFLPAEGVGAVLLKPLSQAIQDRDSILSVIKSTAVNHEGRSNGYIAPNPNAQARLIEDNFVKSGIDPRTISYVEAAANGSALADSIEITALNKAFQKFTTDQRFCAIGSVKSNIGHPEAASGIAQLTKVVLQLHHKQLVPSIKAETLNPDINFEDTPYYLQRELQEWKRPVIRINGEEREFPRRATISSLGAGGSDAHLIVEEYISCDEETVPLHSAISPQIAVFSANNQDRLQAVVQQMLEFVEHQKELSLPNLAYTLQVGREAMESRLAMVVRSQEELIQGLKEYLHSIREGKEIEASIPMFKGNIEADHSGMRSFFSGKLGETVVQALIKEKNIEKIAAYWAHGGGIPWESLHEGEGVRRISLPTYPFVKRRCWIASQPESRLIGEPAISLYNNTSIPETDTTLKDRIVDIISCVSGMAPEELNINKSLDQYGFDSILLMSLFQQLQSQVDASLTVDTLRECRTIQDIINVLPAQNGGEPMALRQQSKIPVPATWPQFPELIHLNQSSQGRPVFWFHGGLGGVELYHAIAQKFKRPFYGIQARGWMTNRFPLRGIQAMSSYYCSIIQSVQPVGPYDLGGYSLGGIIAYEVARQLQELGQVVNTIVMLDSLDGNAMTKIKFSEKTAILQAVNTALLSTVMQKMEKLPQILIHRDEVNSNTTDDEEFLRRLIMLAKTRGLTRTEAQLYTQIRQNIRIQNAYETGIFSVLPLSDSQAVTCYYFRNKSGLFFGELDPYFSDMVDSTVLVDNTKYWEEWEKQLPNFHMIDADSSNHMMLLAEPKSYEVITAVCEKLYSEEGMPAKFIESFMKNHGTSVPAREEKSN